MHARGEPQTRGVDPVYVKRRPADAGHPPIAERRRPSARRSIAARTFADELDTTFAGWRQQMRLAHAAAFAKSPSAFFATQTNRSQNP